MSEDVPELDIVFIKGRTWERSLSFIDQDLTGCTLRMTLVRKWDDTSKVLELSSPSTGITLSEVTAADVWTSETTTLDGARGETKTVVAGSWQADIEVTSTQTAALSGVYYYDIELTGPASAYADHILRGKVTVLGRATT